MKSLTFGLLLSLFLSACVTSPELELPKNTYVLPNEGISISVETKSEILLSIEEKFLAWKTKEPSHYSYVVFRSCCELYAPFYGPNEIEVKDGEVINVKYRGKPQDGFKNGDLLLGDENALNFSIDDIFNFISSRIQKPYLNDGQSYDTRYQIDYDSNYGFPVKAAHEIQDTIMGEHLSRISHNDVALVVYDFKVIE